MLRTSKKIFNLIYLPDVFALVTSAEIRKVRSEQPENLATLCYKATERLVKGVDSSCRTAAEQQAVLNCIRLLTRVLPYIFEDNEWKDFFWSALPSANEKEDDSTPLAQSLMNAICVSPWLRSIKYPIKFQTLLHIFRIYCSVLISLFRLSEENQVPTKQKICPTSTAANTYGRLAWDSHSHCLRQV